MPGITWVYSIHGSTMCEGMRLPRCSQQLSGKPFSDYLGGVGTYIQVSLRRSSLKPY